MEQSVSDRLLAVVASGTQTAQVAAVASSCTFTTPNDGTTRRFRVGGVVNITAHNTEAINLQVTYTDDGNAVQTDTITLGKGDGTTAAAANAAGNWAGEKPISCQPGTAITIKTAGTFTTVTYNLTSQIERMGA